MNNDLISRSALKERIKKRLLNGMIIGWLFSIIDTAPAVDAVEVVRCKDCKHYEMGACLKIYSDGAVSQYAWQERNADDFCSYGERRTDG